MHHHCRLFLSGILSFFLFPSCSFAMHISEGLLPLSQSIAWFAAALPFLVMGLRELARRNTEDLATKPLTGMIAAVVFVISCMPVPVPVAGTCAHPCGTGLAAILLGPSLGVVVAAVALLIQALFMAHGGITTWGANLFAMGVIGSCAGFAAFRLFRICGFGPVPAAFAAGLSADWATYGATALILAGGLCGNATPYWPLAGKIALAFVPTQLPLGIVEGAITAGMVSLLLRKRPDLLIRTGLAGEKTERTG